MNIRTALLIFTSTCAGIGQTAMAFGQSEASLVAGARVRLVQGNGDHVATLVRATGDSVITRAEGGATVSTPSTSIVSLQMSAGSRNHAGKGAMIGAATGLGLGLLAIAVASSGDGLVPQGAGQVISVLLVSTGGGALLGAGIGFLIETERWTPLPSPWETAAARSGPAFRVTLTLSTDP